MAALLGIEKVGQRTSRTKLPGQPIGRLLAAVVLAVLLPVVAFSGAVVWHLAERAGDHLRQDTEGHARHIAASLDVFLAGLIATAQSIAKNPSLEDGDLATFHRVARSTASAIEGNVSLRDGHSRQVVNSGTPLGEAPPSRTSLADEDAEVARNGGPVVSRAYRGITDPRWFIAVVVPASLRGEPGYFLSLAVPIEHVRAALDPIARPPAGFVAGIVDGHGTFVGRWPGGSNWAGQPSTFRAEGAGAVELSGVGANGVPSRLFSHPSRISGWRAGVIGPEAVLTAPVRNALWLLALLGVVALGAGLGGAWLAARRIADAARALRAAGVALEVDQPVPPLSTPVRELNAVGEALGAVARERRLRSAHRELLIAELNHRVKNNLAIVHALAVQTLRSGGSRAEAEATLSARLKALASAHDLLTRENWESAEVREVVASAIAPIAAGRAGQITMQGDPTLLPPRVALALTMALHELTTNALKYGALSTEEGRVSVAWLTLSDGVLRLEWKETGGPLVKFPERRGFGSNLLTRGVARDLGGTVQVLYEPFGVVCLVTARITATKEFRAEILAGAV